MKVWRRLRWDNERQGLGIFTGLVCLCVLVGASGMSGSSSTSAAVVLVPGDVVEVTEGDLMNLQGRVTSVEGNTVTVLPRHEDLKVQKKI